MGPSPQHTDMMVELRESLWRVTMAFTAMVNYVQMQDSKNRARRSTVLEGKVKDGSPKKECSQS